MKRRRFRELTAQVEKIRDYVPTPTIFKIPEELVGVLVAMKLIREGESDFDLIINTDTWLEDHTLLPQVLAILKEWEKENGNLLDGAADGRKGSDSSAR